MMNIDKKATIGSILNALKIEGVKTGDVAKAIEGISEKPFRNALKKAGYSFSNSGKRGWFFNGEGEEPLDKSIFDFVTKKSPVKTKNVPPQKKETVESEVKETKEKKLETETSIQFTQNEIKMIKDILKKREVAQQQTQTGDSFYERIRSVPQDDKTRKTIVIDKTIGKRLDDFCANERVNKSDVLYLALIDFLEKYEDKKDT
ncbi:hypothetical protein [Bacillus badius]|uniref:hypothetical protein n=1 Tax=Bacillus badius TaxID=1455 RepID=UPI0007B381A1|nr:hypothetical protein [Bacillus badius]KZR59369.1 hypothetical protein A3781_13285 [Bacillus badius]